MIYDDRFGAATGFDCVPGDFPSQTVKWLRAAVRLGDAAPMVAEALPHYTPAEFFSREPIYL